MEAEVKQDANVYWSAVSLSRCDSGTATLPLHFAHRLDSAILFDGAVPAVPLKRFSLAGTAGCDWWCRPLRQGGPPERLRAGSRPTR